MPGKHKDMTPAQRLEVIQGAAQRLLEDAAALNINVTIEQRALVPLAMGHAELVISVWCFRGTE